MSGSTVIVLELHADFISGYYMGKRKDFAADRVRSFSSVLHSFGDFSYTNPQHHGSPGQRSAAMEKGYLVAAQGTSLAEAGELGWSYVRNL
jgi:hypothetical protein